MDGYTHFTKLAADSDFKAAGDAEFTGSVSAPGIIKLVELGSVVFGATSGQAATLYTLPKGAILMEVFCVVSEGFNSGDSDSLTLGAGASADALMAAADITEGTPATYRKDAWLVGGASGTAITATLTKAGTAATEGAATFYGKICFAAE